VVSVIRLTSKNKLADLETEAVYTARVKGFEKLMDFSLHWHDSENSGNKVQRIQNGIAAIKQLRSTMSSTGFEVIAGVIGIFAIFLFLNPVFVLFLIVYLIVFFTIHFSFYSKMMKMTNEYNRAQEKALGSYFEGINNVLTIKTLGASESFRKSINFNEDASRDFNYTIRKIGTNKWKIFQIFNGLSTIVFLFLVGIGVVNGAISVGSIFIYYSYLSKLADAAGNSTDIFDRLIDSKAALSRMMPIYWNTEVMTTGHLPFPKAWDDLKIADGTFHYKSETDSKGFTLSNINFSIKNGEKVGIVGASGGGKSTLAKLLLGLYELKNGSFTIGETSFYDINHQDITNHIAIVLQESEMFNLSLTENITLLKKTSPEIFKKAIEIAQLEAIIQKLPKGLDTLIGEKGYRLSGGERQRVGIARAICKNPDILVLDEATSALDSKTEKRIQDALEDYFRKKTFIIIAHRISTLKNVDSIFVFEKGNIVEQGNYQKLITDTTSKFYAIYTMQHKKKDEESGI
jgi:ABC-type multidrug transport system fused ATPase/permease subunit